MDIVTATPSSGAPFHNHDVREWSRLDSITGVLERARLETDHWTTNTATTSHKYNKVVDSRARSGANGNLQQARRKLEVFQSQVPGGRIQVIKTQTVSSSRWSGQGITNGGSSPVETQGVFEDLKLSLNPLDLTSEKAKASVGRGVGRRPPSRSRIRDDILARTSNLHATATTNLHRVSRLCNQIHNSAVKQTFGKRAAKSNHIDISSASSTTTTTATAAATKRENGDGVEITEITDEVDPPHHHTNLSRTKSTSSEDFFEKRKSLEDLEDLEQLQTWRRTSKLRRSLQYPKQKDAQPSRPPDLPTATGSVRKIREDLETGRRLSTALRGNNVDLDALDQILKSISNSSISSGQSEGKCEDNATGALIAAKKKQKRDSFVTVESIQAVRDKLRRTNSPSGNTYNTEEVKTCRDEDDDGIVTDRPVNLQSEASSSSDSGNMNNRRYERSEAAKKQISGTGSLESRNKFSNYKQDDWFARRKSYGFEQMQQPAGGSDSLKNNKNRNESSTDSGICRSTEIVVVAPPAKVSVNNGNNINSRHEYDFNDVIKDDNVTNVKKYAMIFENKNDGKNAIKNATRNSEGKRHSIAVDESKYMSSKREDSQFKRISLVVNDNNINLHKDPTKDDENKRTNKKVEFCKTEVHFAADSGRVNIVETDEKPPPTQRFRRRRRNSGPTEDYSRNGLPVQHFGDSTYEKFLFGDSVDEPSNGIYENIQNGIPVTSNIPSKPKISANVTVNAVNGNYFELDDEPHKDIENEAPRGILKNKPIKPKPFLLGVNGNDSWVMKPTINQDQPIWKSTVTLKKSGDEQRDAQEFQKLRQHLRPTNRRLDYSSEDNSGNAEETVYYPKDTRLLSPPVDERCSSWTVADRIKQVEELKWTENKGYSTKVNFGDGEATVVENKHPTWPRKDEYKEENRQNMLNKSLVVRIGQQNEAPGASHKICSKTMLQNANGSTTTKITIDLSPSPTTTTVDDGFKFPRAAIQSFKSPSLIMNTFGVDRPKLTGLADLKQMYEDAHSDVEADKEVHRILMNSTSAEEQQSSVASGSWSKMRAFKHVHNYEKSHTLVNGSHNHSLVEKESHKNAINDKFKYKLINDQIEEDLKYLNREVKNLNLSSKISKSPLNNYNQKLSSPFLVGQSRSRTNSLSSDPETFKFDKKIESPKITRRDSSPRFGHSVLRQPKKSEMAYFGVTTQKPGVRTAKLTEKPDLLQFNNNDNHRKSYITSAPTSAPIYENMDVNNKTSKTFDSSILEELTKAADEILLAVNGYTDEERSRISTDDEMKARRRNDKLDTIAENKSWKHTNKSDPTNRIRTEKHKSSNSSIDSITRDVHRSFEQLDRKAGRTAARDKHDKQQELKTRKKTDSVQKTAAKARRLQRASSREALLHSHGSSSEDLPNHVEITTRKPRLVKRTKTTQLSVTASGLEMKKPTRKPHETTPQRTKYSERTLESNLPEIRHKTAVTTIRSTAEKQASRERAKLRADDAKKRQSSIASKRDTNKVSQSSKSVDRSRRSKESGRHTAIINQTKKSSTRNDAITAIATAKH